ncbi:MULTISPECIES: glycine/sarcosine/betaine reductase complex component C subunit alpha [unclassified Candidatus Frackibacter]|uniref:glycine/sarcosine/betaine reductase complex component C subunit alpha n=1 Tax=unclassified Candidatus Frackibacter TaxID=2648818 RepID=UPI0008D3F037|nr:MULTISPECIES: glycine/sarcosine/betaine reductase complex component C subunit alpha [unclassified Candidatus Frackibacter]SEM35566.1 Fatty acid synthesis protein [Candidatus Frackibacter sp. WG12]SFL40689.1 Fatty acid synthesis protein [Candidatus Frackibacter sp. WG13]
MTTEIAKKKVAKVFDQIADALESGVYGEKTKIGITTLGSEHGVEEVIKGAELAAKQSADIEVVLIGPKVDTDLSLIAETDCAETAHQKMEELLQVGDIDACVTNHFNFPIGVSTVGKVITPGKGEELIIATSTGTSATDRISAMIKNALYGIIAAKATGVEEPTIGILNVDGARQVEKALKELDENGYKINFAESIRSDGGCVMRGNDLLVGAADVMVTDTLTGNLLMKLFSAFNTGGSYEALGYGYGPGIGEDYDQIINIISRASGAPVIAGAIRYAADAAQGKIIKVTTEEFKAARDAGLDEIIANIESSDVEKTDKEVSPPPEKTVTEEISGLDILTLDDAMHTLWKEGIYAETGMGCTGPVILIASEDEEEAIRILEKNKFI